MSGTPFKMKGFSGFGNSPAKDKEEVVVSKTSPGPGWTKTKGTNIWNPPKTKHGFKSTFTPLKPKAQGMVKPDTPDTPVKPVKPDTPDTPATPKKNIVKDVLTLLSKTNK